VDFVTARTLNGATIYVFAVIEHASRRIRILGATTNPTGAWTAQQAQPVDGPSRRQREYAVSDP